MKTPATAMLFAAALCSSWPLAAAPESGEDLCSQPTMSRLENMPSKIEAARMTAALVDVFCQSFPVQPAAITLDIDGACGPVHGQQQMPLFNARYDTRCFLPVHVCHVESGKPVAVFLRQGKAPSGNEARTVPRHLVRRVRKHWPATAISFRGDSRYGRAEAMDWCESNGIGCISGLAGNAALDRLVYARADALKACRAEQGADRLRAFAEIRYSAKSWRCRRKVIARLEATALGFDARYAVTPLPGEAQYLCADVYCVRGQAGNLIKLHKTQLASGRTSCQNPAANQVRLVLHTGACWLMPALRNAIPAASALAKAEFAALRIRLPKIGARIIEAASRIRVHPASACPGAKLFRLLAGRLASAGP